MHLSLIADVLNCILRSISLVYIIFFSFWKDISTSIVSFLLSSNTLFLIEKKIKIPWWGLEGIFDIVNRPCPLGS